MSDYYSTIMRMRQERAGRERMNELREIQEDYQTFREARDEAAERGDVESFENNDDALINLERRWHQLNPPRPPQIPPVWADWINRNSTFIEREGQKGVNAVASALAYMQRPRNPNTNNPSLTGMGLTPQQIFTPAGMDKLEKLLEINGRLFFDVNYDKNEKSLTADQAARLSGLSTQAYNNGGVLHAQDRLGRK